MNPIALQIGYFPIRWYGILAAAAMLSAYFLMNRYGRKFGLSEDRIDTIMLVFLPMVIVGARTAYVISRWSYFSNNLPEIIRIDQGGLGSHGAIIAVSLAGYIMSRMYNVRLGDIADSIAPAIPLAHVFVRIGNFLNGELYGLPTDLPWGVMFPGFREKVHPSMLYEAAFAVLIFLAALRWVENREWAGAPTLKTMFAVSVGRLMVDFTRPLDSSAFLGLMLTQWLAVGIAIFCGALLYRGSGLRARNATYAGDIR